MSTTHGSGGAAVVRVLSDDPVYRVDATESEPHFFRDLLHWAAYGDSRAVDRLTRSQRQLGGAEVRDIGSGAAGGLVVPQFLTELAEGPVRAGQPLLSALEQIPLPAEGVTFTVPRSVTTGGSSAHAQTSENSAVSETDPSLVNLDRSLVTVAGQVTVSSQFIDRSGSVGERYLARDLLEAVTSQLDNQLINGSGSNGQLVGLRNTAAITTVTWTDATPTRGEFSTFVGRTAHDVSIARLLPPDTLVMHPRRFYWLTAGTINETPSLARPWVWQDAEPPFVGRFANLDILVDSNVPTTVGAGTNEDVALVIRRQDLPVHVGPVTVDVHRETEAGSLEVNVVAHRYAVWFPDRFRGTPIGVLTGTGMVAPGSFTS